MPILDKYIYQYKTNKFVNIGQIHFAIKDKYISQFETNISHSGPVRSGPVWVTRLTSHHFHVWSTRHMVTELLNLRNGQSPVLVRQSISQSVTMISARDASASEKITSQKDVAL